MSIQKIKSKQYPYTGNALGAKAKSTKKSTYAPSKVQAVARRALPNQFESEGIAKAKLSDRAVYSLRSGMMKVHSKILDLMHTIVLLIEKLKPRKDMDKHLRKLLEDLKQSVDFSKETPLIDNFHKRLEHYKKNEVTFFELWEVRS